MPVLSKVVLQNSKQSFNFTKHTIETVLGGSFYENNHVSILESGEELFRAITDSILSANKSICLEFYIFKDDETGKKLAEILKKKALEGVKVFVLYDHFGSLLTSGHFWSGMKKAGVIFRAAHPFKISSPRRYLYRNHKKLLIVDGEKAFTGGFNIADEYYGFLRKKQPAWHDIGVYLEGPVVNDLVERFTKNWQRWKGDPTDLDRGALNFSDGLPVIPIFANTARERRRMRKLYIQSIKNAQESICLTTPYFIPRRKVLKAVLSAAEKGVNVILLLPGKSDIKSVNYASRSYYRRLLNAGVEIYNYREAMLHAKTAGGQ
jgi:cardiolipin synthase